MHRQAWYDIFTMGLSSPELHISKSPTARVTRLEGGIWHLEIPVHNRFGYHLAQLDDHGSRQRKNFPWQPPLTFSLRARVSAEELPGTWGFGLWNDPFSFMLAYNKFVPRLPTLPEAAWFFHASPQNYLSFRDDLPANGFLAATFRSKKVHTVLLALASPILALSLVPGFAHRVRKQLRGLVEQDAVQVHAHLVDWHLYRLDWENGQARFYLDEVELLCTSVTPHPPLSLVIWIDNQYAALPPDSGVKYGYLPNLEASWLEVKDIDLQHLA
jgi:hypothetical protein